MDDSPTPPESPENKEDDVVAHADERPPENEGRAEEMEIVTTPQDVLAIEKARAKRAEKWKGKQPRKLRERNDRSIVGKAVKRMKVAELIGIEGLTQAQAAERLGISEGWTGVLWREALAEVRDRTMLPEEVIKDVRHYVEGHLRKIMEDGAENYADSASYGAVVLQAGRTLLEMHGASKPAEGGDQEGLKTLQAVAASVKTKSPLIAKRLGALKQIKKAMDTPRPQPVAVEGVAAIETEESGEESS